MNNRFFKSIIAVILCFSLVFSVGSVGASAAEINSESSGFYFNPIDTVIKYIKVLLGFIEIGIDYISLDQGDNYPTKREIKAALKQADVSHPFVLATSDEFEKVRQSVKSCENGNDKINAFYQANMRYADLLVHDESYAPLKYELDEDDAILEISREVLERMISLGLAWQVTGETKYAERAWKEIENVCCNYSDWNPSHFLDTAEMSLAMAVGYDWFFDYLTEEQKHTIANATIDKGIMPARSIDHFTNWWVWSKTNWNSVCYGGIGIACMVFKDYIPADAAQHLYMCYKNMPINFCGFTPDGVYAEGPGYWEYGTSYLVYFMKTSENFFGTNFGLSEYDGIEELGSYPVYVSGPTGVFNYGDNKAMGIYSPVLYWFSDKFDNKLAGHYQTTFLDNLSDMYGTSLHEQARECSLSALWYDNELSGNADFSSIPLAAHLESDGSEELVVMRTAHLDSNATYAAIKAGYNYTNHGDLDIGSFVYDALGVRWAEELGPGDYSADGYFVPVYGGGRWKIYEKRAEGQNTLVINPDRTNEDQFPFARAEFTSFTETKSGGKATLDMTDAYSVSGVKKAERSFELDGDKLIITDSVSCKFSSDIYWGMHTKASAEISADGKSAVLSLDGKQLKVTLDGDGKLEMRGLESLRYPDYEYNKEFEGMNKLCVIVNGTKQAKIQVTLEPIS